MGSKMILYGVLFHRPSLSDIFEGDPAAGKEPVEGAEQSVGDRRRKSCPTGRLRVQGPRGNRVTDLFEEVQGGQGSEVSRVSEG